MLKDGGSSKRLPLMRMKKSKEAKVPTDPAGAATLWHHTEEDLRHQHQRQAPSKTAEYMHDGFLVCSHIG